MEEKTASTTHSSTILAHQVYGKERVRFLRVVRDGKQHRVMDVRAGISLEGDFADAYTSDNNHQVVATDTMKNTLTVLAYEDPADSLEGYALRVAAYFLGKFDHVSKVSLRLQEKTWQRVVTHEGPHPFVFCGSLPEPVVTLEATREQTILRGGVRRWELMKTTESGFAGFPRDEFTTLPETLDRILATEAAMDWTYTNPAPADFADIRSRILGAALEVFANEYSPSVQRTIWQIGEAVLRITPEISSIRIAMPNKHYLPLNLSAFQRPANQNICFLPTDEPHGQIEATITRG